MQNNKRPVFLDALTLLIVAISLLYAGYFFLFKMSYSASDSIGRGGVFFVIRFPAVHNQPQEQILFYEDRLSDRPNIIRTFVEQQNSHLATSAKLSPEVLNSVKALAVRWCQNPPSFDEMSQSGPFFEVGLPCQAVGGLLGNKQVHIPAAQLPSELRTIIAFVPSPTCDDVFCGW